MVYKGDGPITDNLISNADPTLQEQEISRYVESTMRTEQKTAILIKAERKVKHREISRVIKAATQGLELSKIHVAVQQSG
jgi:biopolymer transport protein ExbD